MYRSFLLFVGCLPDDEVWVSRPISEVALNIVMICLSIKLMYGLKILSFSHFLYMYIIHKIGSEINSLISSPTHRNLRLVHFSVGLIKTSTSLFPYKKGKRDNGKKSQVLVDKTLAITPFPDRYVLVIRWIYLFCLLNIKLRALGGVWKENEGVGNVQPPPSHHMP